MSRIPPAMGTFVVAALAIASNSGPADAAPPGPAQDVSADPRHTISVWAPEYTSYLPLPGYDGAIALDVADGALWLATETDVSRFVDGVWSVPEQPPGVTKIFALAPTGGSDVWAFGFEGGAWRRQGGTWSGAIVPTGADLYSAVARNGADVWAAGFDYEHEHGVLLNWNGLGFEVAVDPPLREQLLFSIAADPFGELWAGGCNYSDELVLLRDGGTGSWTSVEAPPVTGCVYHLSFGPDGLGLAAAGGDVLLWDGKAWSPADLEPPEGYQWVRVAGTALPPNASIAAQAAAGTGWAIAGIPTWRSYTDGQTPWHFDGTDWQPADVDYRGLDELFTPTEDNPEPKPYVNLATDGTHTWSVSRIGGAPAANGEAAIMSLADGTARFTHPLMEHAAVIDAPAPDVTWVGGFFGAMPLLYHESQWSAPDGSGFGDGQRVTITRLDMATPDTGWALGLSQAQPEPGTRLAWRWNGESWLPVPAPPSTLSPYRLRALPDGSAWVSGNAGQIATFDGEEWSILKDAPPVATALRAARGAPFDVVATDDGLVGCVAGRDAIYRYANGVFRKTEPSPRGVLMDVQLVDGTDGWAIAIDQGSGNGPADTSGVLLRLKDCRPTEVRPRLPERVSRQRIVRDVEWQQMSAVSVAEVWLWGALSGPGVNQPVLVQGQPQNGRAGRGWAYYFCRDVAGISAVAVEGGTDVWLASRRQCGPSAGGAVPSAYARPVSRLRVRRVVDRVFLPALWHDPALTDSDASSLVRAAAP